MSDSLRKMTKREARIKAYRFIVADLQLALDILEGEDMEPEVMEVITRQKDIYLNRLYRMGVFKTNWHEVYDTYKAGGRRW